MDPRYPDKWPDIAKGLLDDAVEIAYLSLSTHYGDRAGQQIARFDWRDDEVRKWMRAVVNDDDSVGVDKMERALREDVSGDDSEYDPEYGDEPDAALDYDLSEYVEAARHWMLDTLDKNTPNGRASRFRIRAYAVKGGKQLWSAVLDHAIGGEDTMNDDPSDLLAALDSLGMDDDDIPTPSPMRAMPSQVQTGATLTPEQMQMLIQAAQMRQTAPRKAGDNGRTRSLAPWEVDTMLHMHALFRSYGAMVLNTSREAIRIQGLALRQTSKALADSRTHNDTLLAMLNERALAEMEHTLAAAESADQAETKAVLGKVAIEQLGHLTRVVAAKKLSGHDTPTPAPTPAPTNGAPTNGAPTNEAPIRRARMMDDDGEDQYGYTVDEDTYAEDIPGVERGEDTDDNGEIDEEVDGLLNFLADRPDVVQALNNEAVRHYLANPENVGQVVGLAQMVAEADAEIAAVDTDTDPGMETP